MVVELSVEAGLRDLPAELLGAPSSSSSSSESSSSQPTSSSAEAAVFK
jgi:hypothetical protein